MKFYIDHIECGEIKEKMINQMFQNQYEIL
jgi:hypothetical protein